MVGDAGLGVSGMVSRKIACRGAVSGGAAKGVAAETQHEFDVLRG